MKYYVQYLSRYRILGQLFPVYKGPKREVDQYGYQYAKNRYPSTKEKVSKNHKLLVINLGIKECEE